jgi:hypothetical protein
MIRITEKEYTQMLDVVIAGQQLREYEYHIFGEQGFIINEDIKDQKFRELLYDLYDALKTYDRETFGLFCD